ncbi:MAG: hypothetical protein E7J16_05480, partial [Gemella haemolysans]|nr:hypothetical protein [Gemella haemolysans]
ALVGTVDSLSVDGKAAERTDLGGEGNEKLFHFTSVEKLTEKTINFAVSTNGKPLKGHSNVPATLNFNWNDATPLTTDQVTAAHQEETKKAQKAEADRLEKERLEKEAAAKAQAEKERLEKEKAQKAEADRLEKERLEKEAAAKAQAEKERLEKEAAAKAQAEKEKLEKEAAAKAEKERLEKEKALKAAVERVQAKNKEIEEQAKKDAETAKETVTKLETAKAQLEKLVKEKEEAINNATTEVEKEKLTTEKAAVEKELTAKATELKTETEKAVKLENKVEEIKKLEEVKKDAVNDIANDKSLSKEEAKQLEAIVKTASLKHTLVAKVVENDPSQDVTVTFDNTTIEAHHLVVQKADEKTVADVKEKVEKLAKKADKNLSVVKTINLHFADSKGNEINKQGETRTVTVAVVANEGEKLEVYYVNGDKLEKVPSVYKDGKLTFFTSHFSLYTIVKTVASNQDTPVPVTPTPSTDSTKPVVTDKGEALIQPELPAFNIEKSLNEEAQATPQNIFGQVDNKESKNVEVEKTISQNTSQTAAKGLKQLAILG